MYVCARVRVYVYACTHVCMHACMYLRNIFDMYKMNEQKDQQSIDYVCSCRRYQVPHCYATINYRYLATNHSFT